MREAEGSGSPVRSESGMRLLAVLLTFDENHPVLGVGEIAERTGVPQSTAYRYVAVLREAGLLDSAGRGSYRVTERVFRLAKAAQAGLKGLPELALPVMRELRDAIDETVLLVRRTGASAVCVDRVESRRPVRLSFEPGQAMALHAGSASRLLLAAMPREARRAVVADVSETLEPDHAAALTDEGLDQVLDQGWAESFHEVDRGIWGTAAAIRTSDGAVLAALGAAGPLDRLDAGRRRDVIARTRAAAERISNQLGH